MEILGWTEGQNLQLTSRFAAGEPERARTLALELVRMQPDVIVGHSTPVAAALKQATTSIPIVFVSITDPVAGGFTASTSRPSMNLTGFTNYDFDMGAKWLEILREAVPAIRHVSLMLHPDMGAYYVEYLRSIQTVALGLGVQATLSPVRNEQEIAQSVVALTKSPGGGMIVLPSAPITVHTTRIISLVAEHRVPAIYPFRQYAVQGGLLSYGVDLPHLFRRAATYADRILRGAKPADLPIQAPTTYQLVLNLKTAKAMGLTIAPSILARADDVIE